MVAPPSDLLRQLPQQLYDKLFDFQKEGVLFALKNEGRCLIGDEMGLGKTLQALSVAYCYKEEWPLLIIVPSSLRYPWIDELEKWFPSLQPGDIHLVTSGTDVGPISTCKVCLIGYGLMRNDGKTLLEALYQQQFQVVVVDESHYLKNLKAARTKVLVPLLKKAKRLLLLTGTPALSRPAELFPQLDCLRPGLFGTWSTFTKRFCAAGWRYFGRNKTWDTGGASNLKELHSKLKSSVLIRREKKDVLHQLPPKQRQKVPFELAECDQKQDLDKHWKDLHSLINGDVADDHTRSNAGFEIKKLISQLYTQTGRTKIGAVCDYILMLLENPGLKFLVFAHHRDVLTAVCQTVMKYNREKKQDIQYIRIDGDVPSSERMHLVNKFQKEECTRVAVLSIQAAGVGLTFTAATDVVFAELHWTPGVLEQCEDRAHRIGQVNSIHIHYLIAKGSIDEWMWTALSRKVKVVSSALNGKLEHLNASVCDKEEIEFLNFATVWVPSKDTDGDDDDDCYFSKEENKSQSDIRSFFTPKGSNPKKRTTCEISETKVVDDKALCSDDGNDVVSKVSNVVNGASVSNSTKKRSSFCDPNLEETLVDCSPTTNEPVSKRRCTSNVSVCRTNDDACHKTEDRIVIVETTDVRLDRCRTPGDEKCHTSGEKCQTSGKQKCHTSVEKSQTSGVASADFSWSCSVCTYRNHQVLPYCEMCNTAKPVVKTAQRKKTLTVQNKELSRRSIKRFSLGNPDFDDGDLDNFDVLPNPKILLSTPKRSSRVKANTRITNTRNVVRNSMLTPPRNDVTIVEDDDDNNDTQISAKEQKASVCIDCGTNCPYERCSSCESIHQLNTKPVEKELDTSLQEDIAAAESWMSSQSTSKASQESWTCGECGFAAQSDECDSCWNPKPSKTNVTGDSVNNIRISRTKDCKAEPSKSTPSFTMVSEMVNLPNSTNSFKRNAGSLIADQRPSCDITSEALLEVKDELDEASADHHIFKYRASPHTSRIYLYNEDGEFLEDSFFTVDVHLKNFDLLPAILQNPFNFKLVQRFVRQWNRLTLPQRKQVCKSGQLFTNPQQILDDVKNRRKQNPSTKRFITKDDLSNSALTKASAIGGSLRIISKPPMSSRRMKSPPSISKTLAVRPRQEKKKEPTRDAPVDPAISSTSSDVTAARDTESPARLMKSPPRSSKPPAASGGSPGRGVYLQAVDSEGCPLCIFCNQPCELAVESRCQSAAWDRRYCSEKCKDDHLMRGQNSSYARQQLFQLEHGICQLCGLDARQLFVQTRNLPKNHRKEFLEGSKYCSLSVAELNKMIRAPSEGQFWHADHIIAVADGGGLCSLDNFRTLCVMCHMTVTANQNRDRSTARKTSGMRDIKSFFKPN